MSFDWFLLGLRLLATLVLYCFLGVALYIIWKDVQHSRALAQPLVRHQLRVLAAEVGPALTAGDVLPLRPVTLLGRRLDSTIILNDAAASGQHARLTQAEGVWWLEDLDSKNGTLLNDLPLAKPTTLAEGDVIGIGSLRLQLEAITPVE